MWIDPKLIKALKNTGFTVKEMAEAMYRAFDILRNIDKKEREVWRILKPKWRNK